MTQQFVTSDGPAETIALGRRLGRRLDPGLCIAMTGTLGAGKTQLVKGLAAGAQVPPNVTVNSPTFVIVNEYPGRVYLYHIDAYRLGGPDDLLALGFDEMITSGAAVLLEWADRVDAALPDDRLVVHLEHAGDTMRRITLTPIGQTARRLLDAALGKP